ncbi:MAG TPA: hypothetical protein VMG41_02050 [Gemmatimonadales bacterium]|nr:hypothetical protein [Gemmatimonadales bacterium]
MAILSIIVAANTKWPNPLGIAPRAVLCLVLSAPANGASWLCCCRALECGDASRGAPVDRFSVVLVALIATAQYAVIAGR